VTLNVALAPPGPVQLNEYVLGAVRAPVFCVPLAGFVPLQAPEAVQEVALRELHVNVEAPPLATAAGAAVNVTVAPILTVTLEVVLVPPGPAQVSVYVAGAVKAPVLCVPLVASGPLQPPDAVQAVALVEFQLNVEAPPLATVVGVAMNVMVGATLTVIFDGTLVPPGPLQISE